MAQLEVIALDTATPQLRAPGGSDTYLMPKDLTVQNTVNATNVEVTNVKAKDGTAAITISDSSGNVGIGGTANSFSKIEIAGTLPTSSNISIANYVNATIPSGTTSNHYSFISNPATEAASFTLTHLRHFHAQQGTIGAGSAITNQYGFFGSSLTGATNNYGVYSAIASGSGRYNFYAAGTADNYFAGNTGIGTSSPTRKLDVIHDTLYQFRVGTSAANSYDIGRSGSDGYLHFYGNQSTANGYVFEGIDGTRMTIDASGNVVVNTAAIATTATDGFLYVPTCAGTPTGTPTTYTGRAPIVVDTTNHKLYFYSGGTWRDAGP